MRLDAVITVDAEEDGLPGKVESAHLLPPSNDGGSMWEVETRPSVHGWDTNFLTWIQDLEAQFTAALSGIETEGRERAILIGVATRGKREGLLSISELERLAHTAGLQVADRMIQGRSRPDPRTFVGKGKLEDALLRCMHLGADVLIFDGELSPSQLRTIATDTALKVLDRTQLILDIFAIRGSDPRRQAASRTRPAALPSTTTCHDAHCHEPPLWWHRGPRTWREQTGGQSSTSR